MWLVASAAMGKTAVCDRKTFGCPGGGTGVGFGNQYSHLPGGEKCLHYFLASGNRAWMGGRQVARLIKPFVPEEIYDDFLHGERYVKTPDLAKKFHEGLPKRDIPAQYIVFRPLRDVEPEKDVPRAVIFFVDPDQLSALAVLANYAREDNENVCIPWAAGCQTLGIYAYREGESEKPRAVLGLTDLSARLEIRKQLGANLMTFTVPAAMFEEMEANVEGSFLERRTWQSLLEGKNTRKADPDRESKS
jgi:hypothetical protein